MSYVLLFIAVFFEVVATVSLKASEEFTRFWPSATVVMCYGVAFYLLSLCLKTIPLGVMYAIWSGLGVVLTALFGWLVYKEHLDPPAFIGIAFILAGVAIIRLFSDASAA